MAERWHHRVGALVKAYRTRRGLSQTHVAELVSAELGRTVPQASVSDHELGRRWGSSIELVVAYRDVFDIPLSEIYEAMGLPCPGERPTGAGDADEPQRSRTTLGDPDRWYLMRVGSDGTLILEPGHP